MQENSDLFLHPPVIEERVGGAHIQSGTARLDGGLHNVPRSNDEAVIVDLVEAAASGERELVLAQVHVPALAMRTPPCLYLYASQSVGPMH